jgi:hypothetical protein
MNRIYHALQEIDIIGKLADLKEQHYRNTLLISAVVELLIENNIVSMEAFNNKIKQLDRLAADRPSTARTADIATHEADRPKP